MAASKKITALNAYTAPDTDDVLPIVDLVGNETKKIKVGDLLNASNAIPLIYKAYISQVGVADPTVTVVYNTIGAIVWARAAQGEYTGTLAAAFTTNKTFFSSGNNVRTVGTNAEIHTLWTSADVCTITTYTGGASADALMNKMPILIEVYP